MLRTNGLQAQPTKIAPERKAMLERLRANIDQTARNRLAGVRPKSALDLIRKSKAEVGLYTNSLWAIFDLITSLEDRRSELDTRKNLSRLVGS